MTRTKFRMMVATLYFLVASIIFSGGFSIAQTADTLPGASREKIDALVTLSLTETAVPSASIAIIRDGTLAYVQAYGDARIEPHAAAQPTMRYSIGSISKQFTAAAILLLAEESKLSLEDPVSRFVPDLTRGSEVTIRELLSHTSGYQDYWPQDYVPPFMTRPINADQILARWARKPLDFEPGTEWQYSNTNFVIAGLIVEKVTGKPLLTFLSERIFTPLGMKSVMNIDQNRLTDTDATGYMRYAIGPLHPAPKEGKGWLFAAGELAMTVEDLAKWDVSMINQSLLRPASYAQMEREMVLKNGLGTRYGLGISVRQELGRRAIEHGGEVSGFTAHNLVFPDDRTAVIVMVNKDSSAASSAIANKIAAVLFRDTDAARQEAQSREVFAGLQQGKIDRSLFTDNCNSYFTDEAISDFASGLGSLGSPTSFEQSYKQDRGGMTFRLFDVKFPKKSLEVWERVMPDGKIEQYQISAQ